MCAQSYWSTEWTSVWCLKSNFNIDIFIKTLKPVEHDIIWGCWALLFFHVLPAEGSRSRHLQPTRRRVETAAASTHCKRTLIGFNKTFVKRFYLPVFMVKPKLLMNSSTAKNKQINNNDAAKGNEPFWGSSPFCRLHSYFCPICRDIWHCSRLMLLFSSEHFNRDSRLCFQND